MLRRLLVFAIVDNMLGYPNYKLKLESIIKVLGKTVYKLSENWSGFPAKKYQVFAAVFGAVYSA